MVEKTLFSKSRIERAGKVLRKTDLQPNQYHSEYELTTEDAFFIAHNWRSHHIEPLLRIRQDVSAKCRTYNGAITAARLKRMQAIRRKLRRPFTLYQIQDIAGCRAILDNMADLEKVLKIYRDGGSKHKIKKENDYIFNPKTDGYRSHHIILDFEGNINGNSQTKKTVELQLRTRLQHVWSTAVEAVGLVRNENLKGGRGSSDWLRIFQLMSAEFSDYENTNIAQNVPQTSMERRMEIKNLAMMLDALNVLNSYRVALDLSDKWKVESRIDKYFLLQFNYKERKVSVQVFKDYDSGSKRYIEEETKNDALNTVLVEVDKVEDLKIAFPNYFIDVAVFGDRLDDIVNNRKFPTNNMEASKPKESSDRLEANIISDWKKWREENKKKR